MYGNGGADHFITGSNINAVIKDYNPTEDKISGKPTTAGVTSQYQQQYGSSQLPGAISQQQYGSSQLH